MSNYINTLVPQVYEKLQPQVPADEIEGVQKEVEAWWGREVQPLINDAKRAFPKAALLHKIGVVAGLCLVAIAVYASPKNQVLKVYVKFLSSVFAVTCFSWAGIDYLLTRNLRELVDSLAAMKAADFDPKSIKWRREGVANFFEAIQIDRHGDVENGMPLSLALVSSKFSRYDGGAEFKLLRAFRIAAASRLLSDATSTAEDVRLSCSPRCLKSVFGPFKPYYRGPVKRDGKFRQRYPKLANYAAKFSGGLKKIA